MINDEGMIPCFDVVSILCDQLNGRLKTIEKFGPPKDMDQNFRTLIYAAPRMEIEELQHVRRYLAKLLGKDFVLAADTDEQAVNKVVSGSSDFIVIPTCRWLPTSTSEFPRRARRSRDSSRSLKSAILTISHRLRLWLL